MRGKDLNIQEIWIVKQSSQLTVKIIAILN